MSPLEWVRKATDEEKSDIEFKDRGMRGRNKHKHEHEYKKILQIINIPEESGVAAVEFGGQNHNVEAGRFVSTLRAEFKKRKTMVQTRMKHEDGTSTVYIRRRQEGKS